MKSLLKSVLFLFVLTGLLAPIASQASETEHHYTWQKGDTGTNVPGPFGINDGSGVFEDVSFSYDTVTEQFDVQFTVSDPGSPHLTATFFTLVVTPGPMPSQCGNEAAVLYFDATGSTPIVTAYTYIPDPGDLEWETGSYQTGDQICSSLNNDCGDWIENISVIDQTDGSRTFNLNFSAAAINSFTPINPSNDPACSPYGGIQFNQGIGFWLETFSYPELSFEYGQDGYISNLDHGCWFWGDEKECDSGSNVYHGMFDEKNLITYQLPFCETSSGSITLLPGTPFNGTVTGKSPDGDPLTITYTGAPTNASITPESGTEDADGMIDAEVSWTPIEADADSSYTLIFTFTEKDGSAVCEIDIEVDSLGCEETDILAAQFSMDGNALEQFQTLRKLTRKLVKATKGTNKEQASKRFKRNAIKTGRTRYQTAWGSTWSFDSVLLQCAESQACVSISNVSTLDAYVEAVDDLYELSQKANRRIKKAGSKAGKLIKAAREARDESLASAGLIPSTQSLCTF